MKKIEIIVKGMTCNHCKATVENNVSAMDGIDFAHADLNNEKVSIRGDSIDLDRVREKIESLGYRYEGLSG